MDQSYNQQQYNQTGTYSAQQGTTENVGKSGGNILEILLISAGAAASLIGAVLVLVLSAVKTYKPLSNLVSDGIVLLFCI